MPGCVRHRLETSAHAVFESYLGFELHTAMLAQTGDGCQGRSANRGRLSTGDGCQPGTVVNRGRFCTCSGRAQNRGRFACKCTKPGTVCTEIGSKHAFRGPEARKSRCQNGVSKSALTQLSPLESRQTRIVSVKKGGTEGERECVNRGRFAPVLAMRYESM